MEGRNGSVIELRLGGLNFRNPMESLIEGEVSV